MKRHGFMTTQRQREIVIEFEKVLLIRKRAVTTLAYCRECSDTADFVGLSLAAELFGTADNDLARFIEVNAVHAEANGNGKVDICIPSMLNVMHEHTNGHGVRLIGDHTA